MNFDNSSILVAGVLVCIFLGWGFLRLRWSRQKRLRHFASPHLVERLTAGVSLGKRRVKSALLLVAVASVFTALARPQAGFRWEEVHRKGIDIMIAVDTSKSMLANDVKPHRLERARLGILDFISKLESDRIGLIPFSGTAFLMCPLTLDYNAFRQSLHTLDTSLLPQGGTDLASAIREAEAAFDKDANHRILVLITDGEDLEGEALAAAGDAAERGITIHTVGVGTPAGELIPMGDNGSGFVKNEKGQAVKSRLDEEVLREIASMTGGMYEPLGLRGEGLEAIYRQKLSLVPEEDFAHRKRKVPLERFAWPLGIAIVLLALEFTLGDRKAGRWTPRALVTTAGRRLARKKSVPVTAASALLLFFILPFSVQASPRAAESAYGKGAYGEATEQYRQALEKSPKSAVLRFNLGAAAYKSGDFAGAAGAFESVLGDEDLSLQGQAYYNLGNTLYRQGQQTEQSDSLQAIRNWEEALKAYEGALALNADDEDARYNHDLVQRRLEELQQQQDQQQDQEQDKQQCKQQKEEPGSESRDGRSEGNEDQQQDQEASSVEGTSEEEQKLNEKEASTGEPSKHEEQEEQDSGEEDRRNGSQEKNMQGGAARDENEGPDTVLPDAHEDRDSGQMTRQEAAALLDSLKGEEGDMLFIPVPQGGADGQDYDSVRDW